MKPCPVPWCKHDDPPHVWQDCTDQYEVDCPSCGVTGPSADTAELAIEAWDNLTRPEQQSADINAACDHHWVIPRFGEEDERVCSKCRVSAEDVTRAEQNTDINAVERVARAICDRVSMLAGDCDAWRNHIPEAEAAIAAMLTTSPRQTEGLDNG
jgi:hypothetical protein